MANQQLSSNTFTAAKFIVSSDATQGTHTTIQAAITAASAGDTILIRDGSFTENITLKAGVNLVAMSRNTTIIGKCIDNGVSTSCIVQNIVLRTNSDYAIATSSGSSIITLINCNINSVNNTGLNTAAGDTIRINNCIGDIGTTGIAIYTGAGSYQFNNCNFSNSGLSTTASSSSGTVNLFQSTFSSAFATSSSGAVACRKSTIDCGSLNITALTTAGTGSSSIDSSILFSGTASAISIGAGTTLTASSTTVSSSNTNAITGSGTLINAGIAFTSTSSLINTSTQTARNIDVGGISFDGGTNNLSSYTQSTSFTPAITFGGGSTGITYAAQTGKYTRIGNVITFTLDLELSNKGSSTGNAAISGLPFNSSGISIFTVSASSLTYVGQVNARVPGGSSTISLDSWATTGGRTILTDAAFVNATFIQITGSYLTP